MSGQHFIKQKENRMSTHLNKTRTHRNVPFIGSKGDDSFRFNIPIGEEYTDARLDILGGRYNAGARIEAEPSPGETGSGKTIKIHWWFDGGTDPFNPPFITYRIRAFTKATEKRAVLVAIENTGHIPFDIGLTGEPLRIVERFVDTIAEVGEIQNAHQLFDNYYKKVEILADTDCTVEKIRDTLANLSKTYTTDLAFIGHGGLSPSGSKNCILVLHDGMREWKSNSKNLTEEKVRGWKDLPDFKNAKLGLVYMMNCYSSQFSDAWLHLGFKTSIGPYKINSMPEPMFTFFWTRYRNGEQADESANKAWEDSKNMWQAIYHPDCQLEHISQPPFIRFSCKDNNLITDSRPVISGDSNFQITDDL
jgi:hypothetical protein